ncbi:MAG TPA: DUF922 domain-containing protein [Mesorhizobium sp.]|jgi:predicted secreted Zn-dependent protease|nr:DUF922 domain-containing protein [Mesorhizobium sp.]
MRLSSTRFCLLLSAAAALSALAPGAAPAANLSKTYSYFTVGGATLGEIEAELARRGPKVGSAGRRHPGATSLSFNSKLDFAETPRSCRISRADVSVSARLTLPRWRRPGGAEQDTRLIWDTLAADIKRHEESHVSIAKRHARELENALRALGNFRDCAQASAKVQALSDRILAKHDAEQASFDRVEGKNFESRILRLLERRLERMDAASQP